MTHSLHPATPPEQIVVPPGIDILVDEDGNATSSYPHASNNARLKSAFDVFNELSVQLTQSYQVLEDRVADLTQELSSVNEQREQELQQKEQVANRLENLLNLLPGGVIVLDQRGVIVETNPAAETMLEPNIVGTLWRELIQRCFSPKDDDGHEVSNHQGRRISIATRSLGKDGQIILLTDQTETRRLQSKLSRHERLTALGKMVSTLAHQVRTPLSSAMLYGNHLLHENLSPDQQHQFTGKLVNRLQEMERQVSDMLLFVKGDLALEDVVSIDDLHQKIQETTELSLSRYQVRCHWDISHTHGLIACHLEALVGAILNLINNSVQAMPEGGNLYIGMHVRNKNRLYIVIEDEGNGIPDEIKGQVTELFYTTKSQGTGIGLSVVDTVARSHKGVFTLENRQQGGVIACLELPLITANDKKNPLIIT